MRLRAVRVLRCAGLSIALVTSVVSAPRAAHADVIERVVGVVNDHAIFLSDLRKKSLPFLPQVMSAPTPDERLSRLRQLYAQILDQLIDDELIREAAAKQHIVVTKADVDHALQNVQQQNHLTDAQFWDAVRQQGFSAEQYREDVRSQLLRLKVVNDRVRSRVNISEQDVRQRYDELARKRNSQLRFHAAHIFFPLPQSASATEVAKVLDEAQAVRKALTPAGFDAAAAAHGGGDLGWLSEGDLPRALDRALLALSPGEISEPVRGPSGYHIFLLEERERGGNPMPPYAAVRDDIFRQLLDTAMTRQEQIFLGNLRKGAVISRHL